MVDSTMVVGPDWLRKQLERATPDLLREMVGAFIAALSSAELDAVCGAPYGEVSAERVNSRNGYRHRDFDTRISTLDVAIGEAAHRQLLSRTGWWSRAGGPRRRWFRWWRRPTWWGCRPGGWSRRW